MKQNLSDILTASVDKQSNIYVLHGVESHYAYIRFVLDHLQYKLENVNKFQFQVDRYFKFDGIHHLLDNGSLFAEQNLIELNFKTKPTSAHEEELVKLLAKLDCNSHLFITTDKLTSTTNSWMKKVNEVNGVIIAVNESDTLPIINYLLKTAHLTINKNALNLLLELNSGNVPELMQEINRLILLYPQNHEISVNDIQGLNNSTYNVYQLSNAYLSGNLEMSQKILAQIYTEAADAILILWIINEDLKKLLKIKAKLKENLNINAAISELRVWGDAIHNLKTASSRLSYNNLLEILEILSELDMVIKGVGEGDIQTILNRILKKICIH